MQQVVRIPVDVTKVCTGMFVTMLDRPWLETPFVFQGFEIRDRVEIEQLQAHCSYVYVDVERSRLTPAQVIALQSASERGNFPTRALHEPVDPPQGLWRKLALQFGLARFLSGRQAPPKSKEYRPSATVRAEAPLARTAYEAGLGRFRELRASARASGRIDADAARAVIDPVIASILRNPDAMAWTVFSKKRGSRLYSRALATAVWCIMFGRHLGFERHALFELGIGGLLLDIGNERLPDAGLDDAGAISDAQYRRLREHVPAGLQLLKASGGFGERVLEMLSCHHERHDGSGYPEGLRGNRIPTFGRIAGIADCYDAMTSKTLYSPALAAYDAARELNGMRDREFQAEVVEQFLQTIGMFPTGSIVELSDGNVGVVLEQNRVHPLRPKIMLLIGQNGTRLDEPCIRNMGDEAPEVSAGVPAWIEKGHEHGAFGIDPQTIFA